MELARLTPRAHGGEEHDEHKYSLIHAFAKTKMSHLRNEMVITLVVAFIGHCIGVALCKGTLLQRSQLTCHCFRTSL